MNYLYGDSTASTLKSNFLEFLRDALDFSVFVLQADTKIKQGHVQIGVLREETDAELGRLERFITGVVYSVDVGEKGKPDSPTAACAGRIGTLIGDAHRASIDSIRQTLAEAVARIDAEEAAGREACLRALGALLGPHDPPDASSVMRLGLLDAGYEASIEGKSEPALEWTLAVAIPDDHLWATPMRIERLIPQLELRAPQLSGWISKEVKVKPQRIERHVVTQLVDDRTTVHVELRTEYGANVGFDFDVDPDRSKVKAKRVGPADDQSSGPFDLVTEDVPLIVDLVTKLRASLSGLNQHPSITAKFEDADFKALPTFVTFVERLVAMMAPITKEISQRSLTPNELVLRRLLGNDRREEIFVAKATLREKLAVLPPDSRALFKPLGLDVVEKAKSPSSSSERPPVRSELPPSASVPPPPPPVPKAAKAPPAPSVPPAPQSSSKTMKPEAAVPPPRNPPEPKRPALDTPLLDLLEELPSGALEVAPESSGRLSSLDVNDVLFTSLKKILTLSRAGRASEAYQEYETLFSSKAFADYAANDQRQALKAMVFAKSHPSGDSAVAAAHKAALPRIQALLEQAHEPADQEMLGVVHAYLGDSKAAGAAFQAALDAEKKKDPKSARVAALLKRVSDL